MTLFSDLRWRGLIHQTTNDEGLDAWLAEKPRTLYAGFDPTASSLHVGSLMGLLMLRRFQQAGHRPIAVVGGATGMIGDPSGKSDERNLLSKEQLQANVEGLGQQMARFLDFDDSRIRRCWSTISTGPALDLSRFPARHRQELPRQRDARQGLGQKSFRPR